MGDYSRSISKRIQHKGPGKGYCVICGEKGKLTRDHVPPKKCNNLNDVEIKAFLSSNNSARVGPTSQGGTHFKTLCTKCNSEILGMKYDPSLVEFSNKITSLVLGAKNSSIYLPKNTYPIITPQRIAKSVVGHVLAAIAVDEVKSGLVKSPMSNALREYVLDSTLPMPPSLEIFYWVYPYRKQVVIKGMGKAQFGAGNEVVVGHVFKFLPLGFWLVWDRPKYVEINLSSLVVNKGMGLDERAQVEIDLYNTIPSDFPEASKGKDVTLLNTYSFIGNQK